MAGIGRKEGLQYREAWRRRAVAWERTVQASRRAQAAAPGWHMYIKLDCVHENSRQSIPSSILLKPVSARHKSIVPPLSTLEPY